MISSIRTGDFQNTGQALSAHRNIQAAPRSFWLPFLGSLRDFWIIVLTTEPLYIDDQVMIPFLTL